MLLLHGNTVLSVICYVGPVHDVPARPYLLLSSSQHASFVPPGFLCSRSKQILLNQTIMLFYCNDIPPGVYLAYTQKLCRKIKTKKSRLANLVRHKTTPLPPQGWHQEWPNPQPERGSISAQRFLLSNYFPSSPRSLARWSVNSSTPSVISLSIRPRKIIVTSCWGTTLNIWGITRQRQD